MPSLQTQILEIQYIIIIVMDPYLVVDMILKYWIIQIQIIVVMLKLAAHTKTQTSPPVRHKHVKVFRGVKTTISRQSNTKCTKWYSIHDRS